MRRTHLSLLGLFVFVVVLCLLAASSQGVQASHLAQKPPPTPIPPTDTPPTSTPPGPTVAPSKTPIGATSTLPPTAPTRTPVQGGSGGGVGPGPAATPVINGCAQSVGRNGISLSEQPGFYQAHVQIVPRGQVVQVLGGPERVDTIWWWLVRTAEGVQGWGNQDEMLNVSGPCGASGGSSGGPGTDPWPVTILPPGEVPQLEQPVVPPQAVQSAGQATPAPAPTLPQTGAGQDWWFPALVLLAVMVVVGVMRRRLQVQPVSDHNPADDKTNQPR